MSFAGLLTLSDCTLDFYSKVFTMASGHTGNVYTDELFWQTKKACVFLTQSERRCLWAQCPAHPLQGQQPVLLLSTSPVSDWITQSEYLNSKSTTYLLSVYAVLLWNDFRTSASYKNHRTLGILLVWSSFQSFFCYITVCLTSWRRCGMQIGLTINDQSHQINQSHRTPSADRLKYILLFLLSL